MKIGVLTIFILLSFFSFAQYPNGIQTIGTDSNVVKARGGFQGRFINYYYNDTAQANGERIRQYPYSMIPAKNLLWLRDSTSGRWIPIGLTNNDSLFGVQDNVQSGFRTFVQNGNKFWYPSTGVIASGDSIFGSTARWQLGGDGTQNYMDGGNRKPFGAAASTQGWFNMTRGDTTKTAPSKTSLLYARRLVISDTSGNMTISNRYGANVDFNFALRDTMRMAPSNALLVDAFKAEIEFSKAPGFSGRSVVQGGSTTLGFDATNAIVGRLNLSASSSGNGTRLRGFWAGVNGYVSGSASFDTVDYFAAHYAGGGGALAPRLNHAYNFYGGIMSTTVDSAWQIYVNGPNTSNFFEGSMLVGLNNLNPARYFSQLPDASLMMEISSTTKAFRAPSQTTTQQNAISTPANGAMIYNTDSSDYTVYKNGGWKIIGKNIYTDSGYIYGNLLNSIRKVNLGGNKLHITDDNFTFEDAQTNVPQLLFGTIDTVTSSSYYSLPTLGADFERQLRFTTYVNTQYRGAGSTRLRILANDSTNLNSVGGDWFFANRSSMLLDKPSDYTGKTVLIAGNETPGYVVAAHLGEFNSRNSSGSDYKYLRGWWSPHVSYLYGSDVDTVDYYAGFMATGRGANSFRVRRGYNLFGGASYSSNIDTNYFVYGVGGNSFFQGAVQIGLNDANAARAYSQLPVSSAILDVNSTTQGVIFPRVTGTQMNAIVSPATGLYVYNTDSAAYCWYNGSAWMKTGSGGSGGSGTLTNFSATDGNGFDFTVTNPTTTPTLTATTTVSNNQIFYSNSGAMTGDANITRSGSGAITIGTSVTSPLYIGGSATSQTLTFKTTTGVGATDAMIFQVGNNGATESFRINNAGELLVGTTTDNGAYPLQVNGSILGGLFALGSSGANVKFTMESGSIGSFVRVDNADYSQIKSKSLILTGTSSTLQIGTGGTAISSSFSASGTLDFPSTVGGTSSDLTLTVTGAAVGDIVSLGVPNGSVPDNGVFFGWVSATNTVTVRYANNDILTAKDPASGTFRATVFHY